MKTLILMRHAKSDWSLPGQPDHDRMLAKRGRLAASLMAAYLADAELAPDHVVISDSRRTQETFARMRPLLPGAPEARLESSLYTEAAEPVIAAIAALPAAASAALVIGHNPALEEAAAQMLRDAGERLTFPTAALAVISLAAWSAAAEGAGALTAFETPKSLV